MLQTVNISRQQHLATVQGAIVSYVVKGRIVKFVGRVHFQVMQRSAISIAMMMLWNKITRVSCVLMGPVSRIAIEARKIPGCLRAFMAIRNTGGKAIQ